MNGLGGGWRETSPNRYVRQFQTKDTDGVVILVDAHVFEDQCGNWWLGLSNFFTKGIGILMPTKEEAITAANAIIAGRGVK